jgi:hypothetical protein
MDVLVVLEEKEGQNHVRECCEIEVEEDVQQTNREGVEAHQKSATFPGSSGSAASLV